MVGIRRLAVLLAAVPAPGWADAVVDTSLNVSTPVLIGRALVFLPRLRKPAR